MSSYNLRCKTPLGHFQAAAENFTSTSPATRERFDFFPVPDIHHLCGLFFQRHAYQQVFGPPCGGLRFAWRNSPDAEVFFLKMSGRSGFECQQRFRLLARFENGRITWVTRCETHRCNAAWPAYTAYHRSNAIAPSGQASSTKPR
jgi:hypothetical protein